MPARCHQDSCTVKWSEVSTGSGPAYQADVDLNPAWMVCEDEQGIRPLISPNAGNIISNPGNGLLATLPAAVVTQLSGNPDNKGVGPGADGDAPQSSDTYSWTNTTGRDALVLVSGEFNYEYGIVGHLHTRSYGSGTGQRAGLFADAAFNPAGAGAPTNDVLPYNQQLAMRLLADINAPATTSRKACRVDIGGVIHVSDPDGAEQKITRVPFFWMVRVAAGATLNMKSQAFYEGPSQTINVFANHVAGTDGNGLVGTGHELWNLQVSAVPI